MRRNRGTIRIFEAILAIIVVFSSLTLAAKTLAPIEAVDEPSLVDLATNILLQMDANGTLSRQIDSRNWTGLAGNLRSTVPSGLYFNLTVFDKNGVELNDKKITSGGSPGRDVYSVEVPIASPASNYSGYIVRLQLSRLI